MINHTLIDRLKQFPILHKLVFLNHAGVSPLSGPAAEALRTYADEGESQAYFGSDWYPRIKTIKQSVARLINARSSGEIAFVANTSTGLNMVAGGFDWDDGDNVVLTNVEFPANRYPWENIKRFGVELIEVRQDSDGRVLAKEVANAVTNRTRMVTISHVQYGSGYCIDLKPISDMVHRAGGYLCVDAIQSLGAMPLDVQAMGIDFLCADGHKWLLSPEGCGILYCRKNLIELMRPPVVGWMSMVNANDYGDYRFELECDARRFEPGSYNVAGILSLAASIELLLETGMEQVWSCIEALTRRLCDGLESKGYRVFSPRNDGERSGIVVFDPPPQIEPKQIVADLETKDIVIVVREGRLRVSPHYYNTPEQIDTLLDTMP